MNSYNPFTRVGDSRPDARIVKNETNSVEDDNYLYAASATDMTGLAPTVAHNEYEAQSYEEVYPYLPPVPPTGVTLPDISITEGLHAEYRKHVTKQSNDDHK